MAVSRRAAVGVAALALPVFADAKNKRKKREKKKVKRNDFGCVNVGQFCKTDGQCCSGRCEGKKDKKKCKAHDAGNCQSDDDSCIVESVECLNGAIAGGCFRTTGQASYCAFDGDCFPCEKDADCVPFCGAAAACVVCELECGGIPGGTACLSAGEDRCTFPPV
jgi:hypothetical protein